MAEHTMISRQLKECFDRAIQNGRVIVFHAPCGYGKTTVVKELLRGRRYYYASARKAEELIPERLKDWDVLVTDDLRYLADEKVQTALYQLISKHSKKRFVFMTRGEVPSWLLEFRTAGLLQVIDTKLLQLTGTDVSAALEKNGLLLRNTETAVLFRESQGYPLVIYFAIERLKKGEAFGSQLIASVREDVFRYLEGAVLLRFSSEYQEALLSLSMFGEFDIELARVATGSPDAEVMLQHLLRYTSMIERTETGNYRFIPFFQQFLEWEISSRFTQRMKEELCHRGGEFFEKKGEYLKALAFYAKCRNTKRIIAMIEYFTEHHPYVLYNREVEAYLGMLPQEKIRTSETLIQACCLAKALTHQFDQSEYWYGELKSLLDNGELSQEEKAQLRGRLLWLDLTLPQRSVERFPQLLTETAELAARQNARIFRFPITCMQPSALNGAKDFTPLSKQDDELYEKLVIPFTSVAGPDAVGLAECAYTESKYYKGEDVGSRILKLVSELSTIQRYGTTDTEFAVVGLLIRNQVDMGQADEAKRLAENLRNRFIALGENRFLPNLDALLCRISLYRDDLNTADTWYRESAPQDCISVDPTKRYQYLTQAMVEITMGRYTAALVTLASLEVPLSTERRLADTMHLNFLKSIAFHRLKNPAWKDCLRQAVDTAEEHGFKRSVSMYASAILPLLSEIKKENDSRFLQEVIRAVRVQASYYPSFLQQCLSPAEALTGAEYNVLKLLCAGKSNNEICEILDIRLPTVKTHVSRILSKLGVRRRNEVRKAAEMKSLLNE